MIRATGQHNQETKWNMPRIDITVQTQGANLQLFRGTPQEAGFEGNSSYVVLSYSYANVILWVAGSVSSAEKQNVIQGIMAYMDEHDNVILNAA